MFDQINIIPITGMGEISKGTDLGVDIFASLTKQQLTLKDYDVVVVTQKIVSKAEGRILPLSSVRPSAFAKTLAKKGKKSAAFYEIVLSESERIVRHDHGVFITQTPHGFIMANSGIDESNIVGNAVSLLPIDPDASANNIRKKLIALSGNRSLNLGVIITDTWGRPWRNGQVNVCIGSSGLDVLVDYRGQIDHTGHELTVSLIAVGDELASAAELVTGKVDKIPAAVIRGYRFNISNEGSEKLLRDPSEDIFR